MTHLMRPGRLFFVNTLVRTGTGGSALISGGLGWRSPTASARNRRYFSGAPAASRPAP